MNEINNKKGTEKMTGAIIDFIILAVIVLAFFFAFNMFRSNANAATNELTSCQTVSLQKGVCLSEKKTNCYELGKISGCPDDARYCCIVEETTISSFLPEPYGGNANTIDFGVDYISINTPYDPVKRWTAPAGCTWDDTINFLSMTCTAGSSITIPLKVKVFQRGRGNAYVFASPYAFINDDPSSRFNASGKVAILISKELEVNASIAIPPAKAVKNAYVKIYPYANCVSTDCRNTDVGKGRGILRRNLDDSVYIIVKYN